MAIRFLKDCGKFKKGDVATALVAYQQRKHVREGNAEWCEANAAKAPKDK